MQTNCPDCGKLLHIGQHRYVDGFYNISYCKGCGFRKEEPMEVF